MSIRGFGGCVAVASTAFCFGCSESSEPRADATIAVTDPTAPARIVVCGGPVAAPAACARSDSVWNRYAGTVIAFSVSVQNQAASTTNVPQAVTWTSSDSTIAATDTSGRVYMKSPGEAIVVVSARSNPAVHATIMFQVASPPPPERYVKFVLMYADSVLGVGLTAGVIADVWTVRYWVDPYGRAIPSDGPHEDQRIIWTLRDASLAAIDSTSVGPYDSRAYLKGVSPGTLTVVAASVVDTTKRDSVRIRIVPVASPVGVRVPPRGDLIAGAHWNVTPVVVNAAGTTVAVPQTVTVSVQDSNVVAVESTGLVARAPGSTTVTFASRVAPNVHSVMAVRVWNGIAFRGVSIGGLTCGWTADGRVWCWGRGFDHNEFGDGTKAGRLEPTVAAASDVTFASVTASVGQTCALSVEHQVYCWGGYADTVPTTPAPVFGGDVRFTTFVDGVTRLCGISTSNRAYCWNSVLRGPPAIVDAGLDFAVILPSRFADFACGLVNSRAYCFGNPTGGALGDGTGVFRANPAAVAGDRVFRSLAVGSFSCGLTPAGDAYCWGKNVYGELGVGGDRLVPIRIDTSVPFASLTISYGFACGLTVDGVAYCWGDNSFGQLGDGTRVMRPTPVPVATTLHFESLVAGYQTVCGISRAGPAYCWGANSDGLVGDGTTTDRLVPTAV
jgi:hypothetical protein